MRRLTIVFAAVVAVVVMLSVSLPARAAIIVVNSTADSGAGTLRNAIQTSLTGDTINITATGTISPLTELPAIDKTLTITGPGASLLTISGASCPSCSGLFVTTGGSLTLSGVTIRNFNISGIYSAGNAVSVSNSVITQNAAGTKLVAIGAPNAGGGIYATTGSLLFQDSTISNNTAGSWGGGISAQTTVITVTITRTTINGNTAVGHGGGIYTRAPTTMINSTVSGNNSAAGSGSGGIYNSNLFDVLNSTVGDNFNGQWGAGGNGLANTITARNTIIARGGGGTGSNCTATTFNSLGNNISSDGTCALGGPGDRTNTNPLLLPLTNNGGPTQTHLINTGSPAIDGGSNTGCPSTDQRGQPRPRDGDGNGTATCDVGAVEVPGGLVSPTAPTPTVVAVAPTATATSFVPLILPQQVQNPMAVMAVMGGIGNGTRNNTPVPARPAAVAPATGGTMPVITPPSTGDAGLKPHPTFSNF